jgi:signal transduction histidine kinase
LARDRHHDSRDDDIDDIGDVDITFITSVITHRVIPACRVVGRAYVMDVSTDPDLLARLASHRSVGTAPAPEHAWLATHGVPHTFAAGEVVTAKGEQAKNMLVVFDGHLVLRTDRGAGSHKIMEWRGGDVGGVLPYSRGASPPNDVIAEEPTDVLLVAKEQLTELTRECPAVTATLVHAMVDRARQFTSSDLRDEKLVSLGKLAAGLAHELNNPASAAVRSAKLLAAGLDRTEASARALVASGIPAARFAAIDAAAAACAMPNATGSLSPLERADREDAMTSWLSAHGASDELALPLAESGITPSALDALAGELTGDALDAALRWLAAWSHVRALSSELERAATRIHGLVTAVKGFAYMDRAPTFEPIDIRAGIADTLTMLASKTRAKSVTVRVEIDDTVPKARAVGAELNQVWMNLLDNAIDAAPHGGHVTVTGARELDAVVVHVIDDGPGIPEPIRSRIFDPFFTTKPVGKGSGLGLDIVRRLLQRHDGSIAVESRPGRTEFEVRVPVAV